MWPFSSNDRRFRKLAASTLGRIAQGHLVIVVGSQSFNDTSTYDVCVEIGQSLAAIDDAVLVTGGVSGVPETVGRTFCAERLRWERAPNTYQVLPKGCAAWDYGETIIAGANMLERREILARLGRLYIAIEGGLGTAHEMYDGLSGDPCWPLRRDGCRIVVTG